ncbi:Hypothetical protein CINCED_3A005997 [Cinara cedri]|uniref:Uncharacterized protein n=1 Tax=Cinara cedri TaxID=506608 RepID=A0A5E4NN19_9HEMI|nr:Hypothetical protein CINCED_3A005997 [Cinara cedri]
MSSEAGLLCSHGQDNIGSSGAQNNLPAVLTTGRRMPRSPSRDKEFAMGARSTASSPQQQPLGNAILSRMSIPADMYFIRKSQDLTKKGWFEEESIMIKNCGKLQSMLGMSKSFSTSDITGNLDEECDWITELEDIRMPNSLSEMDISKLGVTSELMLINKTLQGRFNNVSRTVSTCAVVDDLPTMSQLPSPIRYTSSTQSNSTPPAFNSTDLVRSVNKKVRQNYIQRRLLYTAKSLSRLSPTELNQLRASKNIFVRDQLRAFGLYDVPTPSVIVGLNKYLTVPKLGTKLTPDDTAITVDAVKRYHQPKALAQYVKNITIVDWLTNVKAENGLAPDDK